MLIQSLGHFWDILLYRVEKELINMLQMKIYIYCKVISNRIRIQRKSFNNQKPRTLHLIVQGDHEKTVKLVEVLLVK